MNGQILWPDYWMFVFGFSKDIGFLSGTLFLFSPFFLHLPQAGRLLFLDKKSISSRNTQF